MSKDSENDIIIDDKFFEENKKLEEKFIQDAEKIGLNITATKMEMFKTYFKMLVETNRFMNLTAITEYGDVLEKHFLDSLLIEKVIKNLSLSNNKVKALDHASIIDIGTGAGFPGMVLKIYENEARVDLLDSLNKRINFLNEVIKKLELKSINTYHGRSEDYARDKKYRESYDYVVSRAVANLSTLSEYCLPFVKLNGMFISYKAADIEKEVEEGKNAVKLLGGEIVDIKKEIIPGSDLVRSFVCIRKIKETPKRYPRKAGIPSKEPLR